MGPLFQIIFVIICMNINYNEVLLNYSTLILAFNLLPIYPLDGAKILNIILNKITSFKKSHIITIYTSFLLIILLILKTKFNLLLILIVTFLIITLKKEIQNHHNLFNAFLLERYMYNFNFQKTKTIKNIKDMKRDYKHLIYNGKIYIKEKEFLKKRYRQNHWLLKENMVKFLIV